MKSTYTHKNARSVVTEGRSKISKSKKKELTIFGTHIQDKMSAAKFFRSHLETIPMIDEITGFRCTRMFKEAKKT
uniref:Uncharacterized protein n=1 Tax=Romanomermis culicivorax TaxID=13658 RepID=A0A915HRP9_ROMCU